MSDSNIKILADRQDLVAVANAIRQKAGKTEELSLSGMIATINGIQTGVDLPELTNEGTASELFAGKELIDDEGNIVTGTFTIDNELSAQDTLISQIQTALAGKASASEPVLQTKTVTPTTSAQNVVPDSGYDGLSKVTVNAMPTATQATPSISISSSGLITASATQTAGYVAAGTKSGTKQLTTQAAKTITPSTSSQTAVAKNVYTTGAVTVAAIPSNYEDVGTETNAYTSKIASLETAVTALETELAGKASGSGGSGGASVETCTVIIQGHNGGTGVVTQYIDGNFIVIDEMYVSPATYETVVCGSGIYIPGTYIGASCTDGTVLYCGNGVVYQAPQTAGSIGNLYLERD